MSEKDDDFLEHGEEEFGVDSDEFAIPEDADDAGFLTEDDDNDFDLSEDDVVDETASDEFDFLDETDDATSDASPGEDTEWGESEFVEEEIDEEEYEQEYDGEDDGDASLGWKAWTGLAVAVIVVVGALTAYVMPMFDKLSGGSGSSPATSQQESFPEPPPAPPGSSDGAQQTPPPPPASPQAQNSNGPVSVSPFPEEGDKPNDRSGSGMSDQASQQPVITQGNAQEQGGGQQRPQTQYAIGADGRPLRDNQGRLIPVSEAEVGRSTMGQGEAGQTNTPSNGSIGSVNSDGPTGPTGTSNGNGIKVSDFTLEDPNKSRISRPGSGASEREAGYTALIEDQRKAFSLLMDATERNGRQLSKMDEKLDTYQDKTDRNVQDLDRRVAKLETMIEQGQTVTKEKATVEKNEPVTAKRHGHDSAPKSPSEIKAVQRTLNEHGYRAGKVDGLMGKKTRGAIRRLQKEHGLPQNSWLNPKTLAALSDPKHYSGTYPKPKPMPSKAKPDEAWYVRGVTPNKAVVYRPDGLSYAVKVGSEIPGMGQVTQLDTEKLHVVTAKGVITRR